MGLRGQLGLQQGPAAGMRGRLGLRQGPGAGMRGQLAPLGPLGNPQIRQELNLSDAQVKQLDELRTSLQAGRQQEMEQLRSQMQQRQEQLRAQQQKLQEQTREQRQQLMQELSEGRQQQMQKRQQEQEQLHQKLLQLLTPEQRTRLEQLEAQRPQGRGFGPGMGRGLMRPDSIR
jgi:hypothetical protein